MPGTYYAVVGGDRLTSRDGSRVFASGNGICNIEGEDGVRRRMVFIGDEAYCSACNSVCVIVGGAGVSEQRRMLDLVNGMRRQAVGGDEVLCKCSRPPRVIAVHGQRWMIHDQGDIPQQVARATESAPSLIYDEQFTLIDAAGNVLADTYYIVRMPSGELIHGINDSSSSSARAIGGQRAGHSRLSRASRGRAITRFRRQLTRRKEKNMPDALCRATTNTNPNSNVTVFTSRLCNPLKLSDDGIRFMAVCESSVLNGTYLGMPVVDGMILKVYNDSKGNPTVGLGHLVLSSDHLRVGDVITVESAREFAKKDIADSERAINRRVHVPLLQYEYDALVSVAFNAGPGNEIARLVDKVNTGVYSSIPDYILTYRANGIEWRRRLEARLFSTGNYDARH